MPLKIIDTPHDPHHSRAAVYVPEGAPYAMLRAMPGRPEGRIRPAGRGGAALLPHDPRFVIGVDLGQAHDHTALVAVERLPGRRYAVPLITRAPLGTPYPQIVRKVAEIVCASPFAGVCHLVVDSTGVGRPVMDMLRTGPLLPIGVTITGGDTVHGGGRFFRVPKRDLVTSLQLAFQSGRLEIAAETDHAQTLVAELAAFRVRITAGGSDQYGSWREGAHDDLVLALALAIWWCDITRARSLTQGPGNISG